jgi:hypothetical protein
MLYPMQDAIVAFFWIISNALLATATFRLSRKVFPNDGPIPLVIHAIVIGWACIGGVAIVLGSLNLLYPWLLLGVVDAIAFCYINVGALAYRSEGSSSVPRGSSHWTWFWSIYIIYLLLCLVFKGLTCFPADWDTLMYHLPLIVQWLHSHSLVAPDCAHWFMPANSEVLGFWIVGPFSGDFLISFLNLPATLLLAFASLEVGALLGMARPFKHITALAIISNSVMMTQLLDPKNDIAVAGLFFAAMAYGFRFALKARSADLAFCATSLGLLCGVKYPALGYATCALCIPLVVVLSSRLGRSRIGPLLVLVLGIIPLGGYWYIRNLLLTGQPFYPAGMSPAAGSRFDLYPEIRGASILGNHDPEIASLAIKAVWEWGGPCHAAAFVSLPFTVVWLAVTGAILLNRHHSQVHNGLLRFLLALLTIASGCVLSVIPFAAESEPGTLNELRLGYCPFRYGLPFLSLAVMAFALVLQDLARLGERRTASLVEPTARGLDEAPTSEPTRTPRPFPPRKPPIPWPLHSYIPLFIFSGMTIAQFIRTCDWVYWLASVDLASIGYIGWLYLRDRTKCGLRGAKRLVVVGAICISLGIGWVADRWHRGFGPFYNKHFGTRIFSDLPSIAGKSKHKICLLDYRPYPFFGSDRGVRILNPLQEPNRDQLVQYLIENGATYLILRPGAENESPAWHRFREATKEFSDSHPERFEYLYQSSDFSVYYVKPK